MHFSAKRGLAIAFACRPSVCLSVCLSVNLVDCDHIGLKSWKLIARTISPTTSLFVAKRRSTYPSGTWGNLGETRGGVGKGGVLENKSGNVSKTRKDRWNVTITAYRNSPMLFRTVPSLTPCGVASPFPRLVVGNPHLKLQSKISRKRVHINK